MNNRPRCLNYDKVYEHIRDKYANLLSSKVDKIKEAHNKKRYKEIQYVLKNFLDLYTECRAPTRESISNRVQRAFQRAASFWTKNEPTEDVINEIQEKVTESISKLTSLLDVVRLLIDLRKYAEKAQGKKLLDEPSLLFLTLHAMACHLISLCSHDLEALIHALKLEKQDLQDKPNEDYEQNDGARVVDLNGTYDLVVGALSSLNVFAGVNSASRMNLLPYYQLPTSQERLECSALNLTVKHGLPIIYQTPICAFFIYETWYRVGQKKSFRDFVLEAVTKGKKIDEDAREQMELTSFNCDLLVAAQEPTDVTALQGAAPYAYVLTPQAVWYVSRTTKRSELVNISNEERLQLIRTYDLSTRFSELSSKPHASVYVESLPLTDIAFLDAKRISGHSSIVSTFQKDVLQTSKKPSEATTNTKDDVLLTLQGVTTTTVTQTTPEAVVSQSVPNKTVISETKPAPDTDQQVSPLRAVSILSQSTASSIQTAVSEESVPSDLVSQEDVVADVDLPGWAAVSEVATNKF